MLVLRISLSGEETKKGVEHAAHLAYSSLKRTIDEASNLKWCTFVTLSFGGLYGRFLAKLMVDDGRLGSASSTDASHAPRRQLRAHKFISIASPHLGVRR